MVQPGILTADGSATLFHREVGEHYHSLSGAHLEARYRFIEPCRVPGLHSFKVRFEF